MFHDKSIFISGGIGSSGCHCISPHPLLVGQFVELRAGLSA
ncbi:hypothetical protein ACQKQA_25895 [Pseudomonas sp. NPDC089530]